MVGAIITMADDALAPAIPRPGPRDHDIVGNQSASFASSYCETLAPDLMDGQVFVLQDALSQPQSFLRPETSSMVPYGDSQCVSTVQFLGQHSSQRCDHVESSSMVGRHSAWSPVTVSIFYKALQKRKITAVSRMSQVLRLTLPSTALWNDMPMIVAKHFNVPMTHALLWHQLQNWRHPRLRDQNNIYNFAAASLQHSRPPWPNPRYNSWLVRLQGSGRGLCHLGMGYIRDNQNSAGSTLKLTLLSGSRRDRFDVMAHASLVK